MGVTGLWKLIDSAGKQVTLESLEGKTLAVDASILLHQALMGMKDQPNAHLHVLFLRLCKLLTYKIKPIFVFDGGVPVLKRQTIAARQKRRAEAKAQVQSVSERLKRKAVQRHAVDNVLGKASSAKQVKHAKPADPDLFELPPLPQPLDDSATGSDGYYELPIHSMLYSGDIDISQVDINSEGFKSLPLEYQHEILEELKEHTKHNTASLSSAGAEKADKFSSFQIAKLVKSSKLSSQIESLRKEMLTNLADHADGPNSSIIQANRVMSEDSTHYLLVNTTASSLLAGSRDSKHHADTVYDTQTNPPSNAVNLLQSATGETFSQSALESSQSTIELADDLSSDEESYLLSADNQKMLIDSLSAEKTKKNNDRDSSCQTTIVSVVEKAGVVSSESDDSSDIAEGSPQCGRVPMMSPLPETSGKGKPCIAHDRTGDGVDQQQLSQVTQRSSPSTALQPEPQNASDDFSAPLEFKSGAEVSIRNSNTVAHISESVQMTPPSHPAHSLPIITSSSAVQSVAVVEVAENVTEVLNTDDEESDDDLENAPCVEDHTQLNPSVTGLAEELLEVNKSLDELAQDLQANQYDLNMDLQKHHALSQAVTQQMVDDAVELLSLFGIPYVIAPSEAEAQCAKLEQLGLCNGIITEDSDVWLFGGSHVLKNFFQQDRHVTSFNAKDILRLFGLDKEKLIALALVCGSDYTDGISNAGPVTAIEIISEFGTNCDGIAALKAFKSWVDSVKGNNGLMPVCSYNSAVRTKLVKFVDSVPDVFPNHVVVDAYQNPRIDDSGESFEWGKPDLDLLRHFAHRTLNWPKQKVDDLICPVVKKMNSTDTQSKLGSFFHIHSTAINASAEFQSRRLQSAISKLVSTPTAAPYIAPPPSSTKIETKAANKFERSHAQREPKTSSGRGRKRTVAAAKRKAYKPPPKVNLSMVKEDIGLSEESDNSS